LRERERERERKRERVKTHNRIKKYKKIIAHLKQIILAEITSI
jgi:hypothetical protein